MKIITLSKIGYNAPSGCNWAYGIHKLDLIDSAQKYCMSYTLKENFGGDERLKNKFPFIIETKGVYTGTGTQKITGLLKIMDMESKEVENIIIEFMKN